MIATRARSELFQSGATFVTSGKGYILAEHYITSIFCHASAVSENSCIDSTVFYNELFSLFSEVRARFRVFIE